MKDEARSILSLKEQYGDNSEYEEYRLLEYYFRLRGINRLPFQLSEVLSTRILPEIDSALQMLNTNITYLQNLRNDSLLNFGWYQNYFFRSMQDSLNIQLLTKTYDNNNAGGSSYDYVKLYDAIDAGNGLTKQEIAFLQKVNIRGIVNPINNSFFSLQTRNTYLNRFKDSIYKEDSVWFNSLMTKYNLSFEIIEDITLEMVDGRFTTLEEVKRNSSGNVLYVDYWASWCAPCIEQFPHSKSLVQQTKANPVKYIYISTDKSRNKWLAALEKHGLQPNNHYRITNSSNSSGWEEMNILFIPRYMIYNQKGILIDNDALRPKSQDSLLFIFEKVYNAAISIEKGLSKSRN